MGLELRKRVLHSQHIITVAVLLDHLLVKAVVDLTLQDVRVIVGLDAAS